jgi:hypothetical protein
VSPPSSEWKESAGRLLVTANVVTSSRIISALKIENMLNSKTSVMTKPTPRHVPEAVCYCDLTKTGKQASARLVTVTESAGR